MLNFIVQNILIVSPFVDLDDKELLERMIRWKFCDKIEEQVFSLQSPLLRCPNIQILLIMTNIAYLEDHQQRYPIYSSLETERTIQDLEDEIQDLNRIIQLKDKALEEIKQIFHADRKNSLSVLSYLFKNESTKEQGKKTKSPSFAPFDKVHHQDVIAQLIKVVTNIMEEMDTAVASVSSAFSSKEMVMTGSTITQRKKSTKSSRRKGLAKYGNQEMTENDTSIDTVLPKKVYEVPVEMEILKEIADIDIQVDMARSKSFLFETPIFSTDDAHSYEPQILSDQISLWHHKIYQVPVQVIEVMEVPSDWMQQEGQQTEEQKLIYQIPIGLLSQSDKEKFTSKISQLQEEIDALIQQNERIKKSKEVKKIYEVPINFCEVMEVGQTEMPIKNYSQLSTNPHTEILEQAWKQQKVEQLKIKQTIQNSLKSVDEIIVGPNAKDRLRMEIANCQSQTDEAWFNRVVKIPQLQIIEVPLIEQKIIEKIVKIPYIQPVEIPTIKQNETKEEAAQTEIFQSKTSNQYAQTELLSTSLQRIAKIPVIKPIQIPVQVERVAKIPILQTVEIPVESQRIAKIPVIKPVEIVVESQRIVKIPVLQIVQVPVETEKIVEVEKIVQKIKIVEVPVQVEVPVIKEVPVELVIEQEFCNLCHNMGRQVIIKEVPVEVVVDRIVEVPKEVQKIKLVEVPVEVEVIKQVQKIKLVEVPVEVQVEKIKIKEVPIQMIVERIRLIEVPVEVEVVKEVQVIKEVEVIKEIQIIKEVEVIKEIEVIKEVEVIKQVKALQQIEIVKQVEKIIVKQVPIELQVIKQVPVEIIKEIFVPTIQIREVPVEVQIIKEVFIPKIEIKQIPVEVEVVKQVFVEVVREVPVKIVEIHEVPIEVVVQKIVIHQVPIEVVVEKEIQVIKQIEKIVQVPVIHEVPIEVVIEVQTIKQVKKIIEIPVYIVTDRQQEKAQSQVVEIISCLEDESAAQFSNQQLLTANLTEHIRIEEQKKESFVRIFQIPVELEVQSNAEHVSQGKMIEIEKIKQKYIEVQRPVEIPVELIRQVPIIQYIPIEIIKEIKVPYIFELPLEMEMEKVVEKIVEKEVIVEKIIEKEIIVQKEVIVEKIVEIPVEIVTEIEVEKIVYIDRLLQIPIQLQMEREVEKLYQIVEVVKQIPRIEIVYVPVCLEHSAFSTSRKLISQQSIVERTSELSIKLANKQESQEILLEGLDQNEIKKEKDHKVQTINNAHYKAVETNELAIQTEEYAILSEEVKHDIPQEQSTKVVVFELPIELQIQNEQRQREIHLENIHNLCCLKARYEEQIEQLHAVIADLEQVVSESNERQSLVRELRQQYAFEKASLLKDLDDARAELQSIQESAFQNKESSSKVNCNAEKQCQTEEMFLFEGVNTIEIPIDLQIMQRIEDNEVYNAIDLIGKISQDELYPNNDYNEQIFVQKRFTESQLVDVSGAQRLSKMIYEIPVELRLENDDSTRKQFDILEVPIQIIIEIDGCDAEIQTINQSLLEIQHKIYQVPLEYESFKELQEESVQTDKYEDDESVQTDKYQGEESLKKESSCQQEVQTEGNQARIMSGQKLDIQQGVVNQMVLEREQSREEEFTYKIFQVPLEINPLQDVLPCKKVTEAESQTQEEIQELKDESQAEPPLRSTKKGENSAEARHLRITSGLSSLYFFEDKMSPFSEDKESGVGKKIRHMGSQITINAMNNESQVQSMTPGALNFSTDSYGRFPPPANINISVIRRNSNQSDNKFFGSLDIRQELMGKDREDPIVQIRQAHKKLTGFEQQSSQQDDNTPGCMREMIIEVNETLVEKEVEKDLNCIQTPNLDPHDLNFSEYANLNEKQYTFQEERQSDHQLVTYNPNLEIQELKSKIQQFSQIIQQMNAEFQEDKERLEHDLKSAESNIEELNRNKLKLQLEIEEQKNKLNEVEEEKGILAQKQEMLIQKYNKQRQEAAKHYKMANQQLEKYQSMISEKQAELRQAKSEQHHSKMMYEAQLQQVRDMLIYKEQLIDSLQSEVQIKTDKIDQLQNSLQEMRKYLVMAKHNQQVDTAAIYEQEFERIKIVFDEQRRQLEEEAFDLRYEIQKLKECLAEQENKVSELGTQIIELEQKLSATNEQNEQLHQLKSQIQNNYIENVKYLNNEIDEMKEAIRTKDDLLQWKESALGSCDKREELEDARVRIQYLSNRGSRISKEDRVFADDYCKKLELVALKYEEMLMNSHETIEQLQDKVCEYLKDALDKQQEAQSLYIRLVDFQNTLNNVLVEKVTLEVENKRLLKSIEHSEKKLAALGNRLIEVARKRAEYEEDEEDYYYD